MNVDSDDTCIDGSTEKRTERRRVVVVRRVERRRLHLHRAHSHYYYPRHRAEEGVTATSRVIVQGLPPACALRARARRPLQRLPGAIELDDAVARGVPGSDIQTTLMLYGSMGVVKRENGPIVRARDALSVDSLSRTYITDTSL